MTRDPNWEQLARDVHEIKEAIVREKKKRGLNP